MRCPACHARVTITVAMPVVQGQWCPSCGSAVPWEDETCPHCGLPMEVVWARPTKDEEESGVVGEGKDDASPVEGEGEETQAIPRIESAIPAEDDPTSKVAVLDEMPRTGRLVLASIFAIALAVGAALYILHPWNPDAYSIKATEEADTSTAGFPGTVETLTGQDKSNGATGEVSGDDADLAQLTQAYDRLGRYAARADANEAFLADPTETSDSDVRQKHKHDADLLAIDVRNMVASLKHLELSSDLYAEDLTHQQDLADWLQTRVKGLVAAWEAAGKEPEEPADDPDAEPQETEADIAQREGAEAAQSFTKHYEEWKPEKVEKPEAEETDSAEQDEAEAQGD